MPLESCHRLPRRSHPRAHRLVVECKSKPVSRRVPRLYIRTVYRLSLSSEPMKPHPSTEDIPHERLETTTAALLSWSLF